VPARADDALAMYRTAHALCRQAGRWCDGGADRASITAAICRSMETGSGSRVIHAAARHSAERACTAHRVVI